MGPWSPCEVMHDISSRADIELVMRSFYDRLFSDSTISHFFTDIHLDLEEHFPHLIDFWDGILFGSGAYRKNAMQPHLEMALRSKVTKSHFETWLNYLFLSIDEKFEGINAHTMKARAQNIASLMEHKINELYSRS